MKWSDAQVYVIALHCGLCDHTARAGELLGATQDARGPECLYDINKCKVLSYTFGFQIMFCRALGLHWGGLAAAWALNTT